MSSLSSKNPFRDQVGTQQQELASDHLAPPNDDDQTGSQSPYSPATPERGSRESSPAHSEYDGSMTVTGPSVKALDFYHTTSHYNIRIVDAETQACVYYAENSRLTPGKPDVVLFAGDDKKGFPIAGVARWSYMRSKNIEIGLGNPGSDNEHAHDLPWETMQSSSWLKQNEHKWSLPNDQQNRVFVWKRTSHEGVEDEHNSWSGMNFKLQDAKTEEVLATFASNRFKSWKKQGKFTFRQDRGEEWKLMALLGCLALIEKSRRRSRARRTNHGYSG